MMSRARPATQQGGLGFAVLVSYLSFGILTWTREFPSLSLHCQFPHCKHFNDLGLAATRPPEKGVKKIAHAIFHIVSRKSVAKLQPLQKLTKFFENFF